MQHTYNDDDDDDDDDNDDDSRNSRFIQSPHCAANCLQHVRSCGQGAIACKSRATHRALALITCNMSCAAWYEGTAQLLSLTELKSHLFQLFYWMKTLTDEGGEEIRVPGGKKKRTTSFRKCYILSPKIQAPTVTRTGTSTLVAG